VERDQVLAFRLARHGLAARRSSSLADAVACPASDFTRGSGLLAIAARFDTVTRQAYDDATDSGELVLAPSLRAAIHSIAPDDFALYATLVPDPDLRKRLFRPVASPGAVLQDGRVAGLWRVRVRGKRSEIEVEPLERIDRGELEAEAARVAQIRGSDAATVRWS